MNITIVSFGMFLTACFVAIFSSGDAGTWLLLCAIYLEVAFGRGEK